MPALKPTSIVGTIAWLGHVAEHGRTLRSQPVQELAASFAGVDGDSHTGLIRASCVRTTAQYPEGTEIRNVRQISIVSVEELALIAQAMEIDAFDPAWAGATMVVQGIPDFSHVPPASRLQTGTGASLTVDMQNRPCIFPGRIVDEDLPGKGAGFLPAAKGRRGVTAWVEREGMLTVGDSLSLHIPDQRPWNPE